MESIFLETLQLHGKENLKFQKKNWKRTFYNGYVDTRTVNNKLNFYVAIQASHPTERITNTRILFQNYFFKRTEIYKTVKFCFQTRFAPSLHEKPWENTIDHVWGN